MQDEKRFTSVPFVEVHISIHNAITDTNVRISEAENFFEIAE